jgi:hypothetical protein
MARAEGFVHGRHQRFIRQHLIGRLHPVFAQIVDLCSDQAVAEAALRAPHLNHAFYSHTLPPHPAAAGYD